MNTTTKTNGHATEQSPIHVLPAKRVKEPEKKEVFDIDVRTVAVSITGTSPLIQNRFHGADDMEAERALDAEAKRGLKKAPKPPVIPCERYALARILDEQGRDCVEAAKVKAALVTAASKYAEIGVPSTVVRGAVYVVGNLIPIIHKGITPKSGVLHGFHSPSGDDEDWKTLKPFVKAVPPCGLPRLRRDITRVGKFGSKQPDLRYRPEFTEWSVQLVIEYEPALVSQAGLHQLIRRAGRSVGLYEWRPEKSPAGIFGRFDLTDVVKAVKARRS